MGTIRRIYIRIQKWFQNEKSDSRMEKKNKINKCRLKSESTL